jgi:uncharacterized SAM-binding protein YcdF (DUF218 family)
MAIVKFLWSLIINLDLIVIAILAFGTLKICFGKTCSKQKPVMATCAILLIFILGDWSFSGRDILRRLEAIYPVIEIPEDIHGIVLTGGSLCLFETDVKGTAVYHKTAGRLIEAIRVIHAKPHASIIFAGSQMEGEEFLKLANGLGIKKDRIKVVNDEKIHSLEDAAVEAVKLAGDEKSKKWLLITSAFSMPRTMSIFKANDWDIRAFPVDFHTIGHNFDKKHPSLSTRLAASFQDRLGLVAWNIAWREIAGLSNLYLSGKTKTLLPVINAAKT